MDTKITCEYLINNILICMKDNNFKCQSYYNKYKLLKCNILDKSSYGYKQKYYNHMFDTVSTCDKGAIVNDYKYLSGLSGSIF